MPFGSGENAGERRKERNKAGKGKGRDSRSGSSALYYSPAGSAAGQGERAASGLPPTLDQAWTSLTVTNAPKPSTVTKESASSGSSVQKFLVSGRILILSGLFSDQLK